MTDYPLDRQPALLPLMGGELRAWFIAELVKRLTRLAIHIHCGRAARPEESIRRELDDVLNHFLTCYVPLIQAANHLCSVEADWLRDTRLLWRDLVQLAAHEATAAANGNPAAASPPKAAHRIKRMDRTDPVGAIMMRELEQAFARVVGNMGLRADTTSQPSHLP